MTQTRVIAYAPNGARQGPIPTPLDLSASFVLNDVGALTLNYPAAGPRSELLGQPVELAVEVSSDQGQTWTEPRNARFLYLQDGRDPIKTADAYAISAPSYAKRLEKALVGAAGLDDQGKRTFTTATPGAILAPLFAEAQARGALAGMAASFNATQDSAGTPWPTTGTYSYDPGQHLLSVLQALTDEGLVDYCTDGRTLHVFVAEHASGMAADRTVGALPVSLRYGRDLTEAPFRRTWEALADTALVMGEGGVTTTRTNPAALKPWGVQETYVAAGGVSDAGTLATVGDATLTYTEGPRTEHTFGLDFSRATTLPFRDYAPGEWVYAAPSGAAPERMRVRQITLTRGTDGRSGGNVVLNDRFLEADVLQARRIQKLLGGGTQAGTGSTPSGVGNDILAPDRVLGLEATSSAYVESDGRVRSQVTVNWLDVTTNADGSPMSDLDHYEVWGREPGVSDWEHVADVTTSSWTASPFDPGTVAEFQVRAVDTVDNRGAFSIPDSVTMSADNVPPPPPSAPTGTSRMGTARISWDGLDNGADDMAGTVPDFAYVSVHVSQVTNFTPDDSNRVGELTRAGYAVAGPLTYGAAYYARLVAWDTSGNQSAASAQLALTVAPLVDVSNFPDDAMAELYARTGHFLDLTADNFSANLIEGSWVKAGAISADKLTVGARGQSVLANSFMEEADANGKPSHWGVVWGGTVATLTGETAAPVSGTRSLKATFSQMGGGVTVAAGVSEFPVVAGQVWYVRAVVRATQATTRYAGVVGHTSTAAGNPLNLSNADTTWHFPSEVAAASTSWTAGQTRVLEGTFTVPASHTKGNMAVRFGDGGAAGDVLLVDAVECWPAATDSQITEMSAGKLKTGVVQATERIVAGTLTGARAELNGLGFQAFKTNGEKTFEVLASSGELWASGAFRVGSPGGPVINLATYGNIWGNINQGVIRFEYPGSIWAEGQILNQYAENYGALRFQSPYVGDIFQNTAYLDLRGYDSGHTKAYLRAAEMEFSATTYIMGSGSSATTVDFRLYGAPGFTFTDYSATSRLNLYPEVGNFTIRSGKADGNTQNLTLNAAEVRFLTVGQEVQYHYRGNVNAVGFHHFGRNVGISYGSDRMRVTDYNEDFWMPIAASQFIVMSDPTRKAGAAPVAGALAVVRDVPVYDYEMEGVLPRATEKATEKGQRKVRGNRARGIMADDLQRVLPDAVNTDENGILSLSLYDVSATLWAALQEEVAEREALGRELATLRAQTAKK